MTIYDGPVMHIPRPEMPANVAGVSCGMTTGQHSRARLTAGSERALQRAILAWRCVCGRGAFGEGTRRPAPAEPRGAA